MRVEIENSRTVPTRTGQDMNMNFASVILPSNKKEKNLAVAQLEKGMASCNLMKSENVSKYLEDLLVAEKKA